MKFISLFIPVLFVVLSLLFSSCSHDHSAESDHDHEHETDAHDHQGETDHGEGEIHLTKQQVEAMNIQFGDFSQIKINDYVRATGTLGLPPNALTSLSTRASGFIKESKMYVEGSYLKKGTLMAYLENPDFIRMQQEYLEVAAELHYARQELSRQEGLLEAAAGVEKNVQKLQSEVARKTATSEGIGRQLAYLGINAGELSPDRIVERIPIYAPASGYITAIKMHNGMFVKPEMKLMEIVNEDHLHLELDVFEKDIGSVAKEQRISFTVPALGDRLYEGEVHIIGKEFNTENKTVRVHGHLGKERPPFIKDLFVEARIWMNDQTVEALPEQAVIKKGSSHYIYVTRGKAEGEEVAFEEVMVIPGQNDQGFTAVKLVAPLPARSRIVTSGAYYVYAQSVAGSLEHSH